MPSHAGIHCVKPPLGKDCVPNAPSVVSDPHWTVYFFPLLSVSWLPLTAGHASVDIDDIELVVNDCVELIIVDELSVPCIEVLFIIAEDCILELLAFVDVTTKEAITAASTPALVELPVNWDL